MKSIRPALLALFTIVLVISNLSGGIAQTPGHLTDFWEMETRYTYSISTWNTEVGQSIGTFAGIANHASVGNKYLFRTETIVRMLNGDISSKISSELFTDSKGYPSFYTAEYIEKKDTTRLTGVISPEGFQFQKLIDTTESDFTVNSSPTTVLCDKQSIPLWNLAFYNEPDLEADTITFHVMIPYLETRAVMTMVRQPDSIQTIMGEEISCKVFFSLRTEEYYYITPDHHVALVTLPKQNLRYELVAVEKVEIKKKKEGQAE